jgi:hypothetical protein
VLVLFRDDEDDGDGDDDEYGSRNKDGADGGAGGLTGGAGGLASSPLKIKKEKKEKLKQKQLKRRYLMVQRPPLGLLAGQWEFPSVPILPNGSSSGSGSGDGVGSGCKVEEDDDDDGEDDNGNGERKGLRGSSSSSKQAKGCGIASPAHPSPGELGSAAGALANLLGSGLNFGFERGGGGAGSDAGGVESLGGGGGGDGGGAAESSGDANKNGSGGDGLTPKKTSSSLGEEEEGYISSWGVAIPKPLSNLFNTQSSSSSPSSSSKSVVSPLEPRVSSSPLLGDPVVHLFSHQRHTMHVLTSRDGGGGVNTPSGSSPLVVMEDITAPVSVAAVGIARRSARWMGEEELAAVGVTTGMKKVLEKAKKCSQEKPKEGLAVVDKQGEVKSTPATKKRKPALGPSKS